MFGESVNDCGALKELVVQQRPDLARSVRVVPKPASLTRRADVTKVRDWVAKLSDTVKASTARGQPVAAVVVHRDADRVDLNGEEEARLASQLAGIPHPVPAVPVATLESWWLLHGDATESINRGWRGCIPRTPRTTDAVDDPKGELQRLTRKRGRGYVESDSVRIATAIRDHPARNGTSPSFDRFVTRVEGLPRV